jgi:hypothetical protein
MIVGHRWEHTNKYPNGQRWLTSVLLGCSKWVLGTHEMSGYKNQPWPLEEDICKEDFERIDPHVFRGGEKSKFKNFWRLAARLELSDMLEDASYLDELVPEIEPRSWVRKSRQAYQVLPLPPSHFVIS